MAIKLVKRFLQRYAELSKCHLMSLAGVGCQNHFHIIVCSSKHLQVNNNIQKQLQSLWGKGRVQIDIWDQDKSGAESYTLEKHSVVDELFQRVFCPHLRHECQGKKGCVLIRDRSRYRLGAS